MKEETKEKYILFSPVSGADPISKNHDGPMLHICREYKPEVIVLYITDFMKQFHKKDNRYRECINRLYENKGFKPLILLKYSQVVQPHLFEEFFPEFKNLLNFYHNLFKEHKMIVNISSGTPQMKANLYMLSSFLPFPILSVQTDTHEDGPNNPKDYFNLETDWEENEDHKNKKHTNRCKEPTNRNLNDGIQKKNLNTLINSYDYAAALKLHTTALNYANEKGFQEMSNPKAGEMLTAAKIRSELNSDIIYDEIKEKFGIDRNKNINDLTKVSEYLLWLEMKLKRGDYGDYLRCLTPALFELMKLAVEDKYKFKIQEIYCKKDELENKYTAKFKSKYKNLYNDGYIGEYKKEKYIEYDFLKILRDHTDWDNKPSRVSMDFLSSKHYDAVIKSKFNNELWARPLRLLRVVETTVRNELAHAITPITKRNIAKTLQGNKVLKNKGKTINKSASEKNGYITYKQGINSVEDIQTLIEEAVKFLNEDKENIENTRLNVNWGAYDEMNKEIKQALDIPITESQTS